jgi:hypothetical protein
VANDPAMMTASKRILLIGLGRWGANHLRFLKTIASWVGMQAARASTSGVFRRERIADAKFFNGAHRFLPTFFKLEGFHVAEVPASTPRFSGSSYYGVWTRFFKSFRDLLAIRWMKSRKLRYEIAESLNCL